MAIPFYDQVSAKLRQLMGRDREQQQQPNYGGLVDRGRMAAEYGFGGVPVFSGIVLDDYNPDLVGTEAIRTADKMRRTLGQVRALTKVITLPITSTPWYLEAHKDADAEEKKAVDLLQANLFGGMEQSWDALIREACLSIYFGFRAPEIVWEERDGLIGIRKIASRNPELIERWCYHPNGDLAGYIYAGNRPSGLGIEGEYSTSVQQRVPIPIEKVLHFPYEQENENPQGFGLWRSMYPHWYFVFALYKVMGIGVERNLLGVPYAEETDNAQPDDKAAMLQILRWMRAAEDGAFAIPKGWKVGWFESQRSPIDALPLVEHHLRQIALTGLAQFLNLGMSGAGTQALGEVHAKLFERAEDANAKWIREIIEQQLIKRWCLINYGPGFKAPRLMHKPIKAADLQAWSTALNTLASGGFLHATVDDEAKIREEFELPEVPKEQLLKLEAERKAQEAEKQKAELAKLQGPPSGKQPGKEPIQASERIDLDRCGSHTFAEDDAATQRAARDAREQSFAEQATEILSGLQEGYLEVLRPIVEEAQSADPISQGVPLGKLSDVAVPGAARYQRFVRKFLWDVLEEGRAAQAAETGQDNTTQPVPNALRSWVTAKSRVIAADHVSRLQTSVLTRVLTGVRAEMEPSLIFSEAGAAAIEELNRDTQRDWNAAAAELLAMLG